MPLNALAQSCRADVTYGMVVSVCELMYAKTLDAAAGCKACVYK